MMRIYGLVVYSSENLYEYKYSDQAFLPRDAMHKRGLCRHAVSVCPFVRPFVTFVDHVLQDE